MVKQNYKQKKNYKQKGGITLSTDESEIFDRIRRIKTIREGNEREKYINDIDTDIQNLISDFSSINLQSQFRNWDYYIKTPSDTNDDIYSSAFKKSIETANNIIINNEDPDIIYISIGKAFVKFSCNNNEYKNRLIKHIINLNKVRVWNKEILKLNLEKTITDVIKCIGNCDNSYLSRMTPACLKSWLRTLNDKSINLFFSTETQDSSTISCDETELNNKKEISQATFESVNIVRSKFVSLKKMFDANIVSYKEFEIKKRTNPVFWLTNPGILTSLTVLANTTSSLMSIQSRLALSHGFDTFTDIVNKNFITGILTSIPITAVALASVVTGIGIPFSVFAGTYLFSYVYRKITNSAYLKTLKRNSEINNEFNNDKIDWIKSHSGIVSNDCSLSKSEENYFKNFTDANNLIEEYLSKTKSYYDTLIKINYDFNNVYTIICQEPLDNLSEPIVETTVVTPNLTSIEDRKINAQEINNLIGKLIKANCAGYGNPYYQEFIKADYSKKSNILKNIDLALYSSIYNIKCTPDAVGKFKPFFDYLENEMENEKYINILDQLRTCSSRDTTDPTVKEAVDTFFKKTIDEQIQILKNNVESNKFTLDTGVICNTPNIFNNIVRNYIGGVNKKQGQLRKRKTQKRNKKTQKLRSKTHRRR